MPTPLPTGPRTRHGAHRHPRRPAAPVPALVLGFAAALALLVATPPAAAEVVDSADHGFTSRNAVTVAAPAGEVYTALTEIGRWWNPSHTFSGDAANMSLEARPQGCFCESLPDGGGVRHMTVVAAMPGKLLRMAGGLGPLQGQAVSGALTWELQEADGATTVTVTYAVHGYTAEGLAGWSAPVDGVVREQLERLGRYAATGSPEPTDATPGDTAPETAPDAGDEAPAGAR